MIRGLFQDTYDPFPQGSDGVIPLTKLKVYEPLQDVANIIRVRINNYSTEEEKALYELPHIVELRPFSVTTIAAAGGAGTASWVTPLEPTTDYAVSTVADGSNSLGTGQVTVSAEPRGAEISISINNQTNVSLYLTKLEPRGVGLKREDSITIEVRDQGSIDEYGERNYATPATYLSTVPDAVDYANHTLNILRYPQRRALVSWLADEDHIRALTLEVGDRVSLEARSTPTSMFIESITHRLSQGLQHLIEYELSPAEVFSSQIVLDAGPGLGTGILGR